MTDWAMNTAFTKSIQVCRSDMHRSSFDIIPGDTISQPVSDGRTGCRDVLLMSGEMKFTIISGQ
ncbi:hypothetical protein E3U43_009534 [Larimichthys crocea]|uniref:Uncharacterized protein n=1 Tax=Larimichthys crocea TaxID=215358 RepID=A0ACD3QB72_LARCR|nr:hypothetical protein E3U43_009534 [Larimichthys crocea]